MGSKKVIVAHRGASLHAQENTLKAYEEAIELGTDMLEFDVRRTRDGYLIAYHDENIVGRRIDSLTLDEATSLSEGLEIPTLEQVLLLTKKRIRLDVELKEEGYEEDVLDLILKHFSHAEFMVSSFNDESLKVVKKAYPNVATGLILGKDRPKNLIATRISELFPIRRCRRIGADTLIPHWKLLRFGFLQRAKKHNKSVMVWTVNERSMLSSLLGNDKVDGIITDTPDLAMALRDEPHFESR